MKHFGDNSNPNPMNRFMADEDSMTIQDTDPDEKGQLDGVDLGQKSSSVKPLRTSSSAWDVDVVPEV